MNFPCYATHAESCCLSCGAAFLFYESTEHAHGEGAYKAECRCGFVTWYDITPKIRLGRVPALRGFRPTAAPKINELSW